MRSRARIDSGEPHEPGGVNLTCYHALGLYSKVGIWSCYAAVPAWYSKRVRLLPSKSKAHAISQCRAGNPPETVHGPDQTSCSQRNRLWALESRRRSAYDFQLLAFRLRLMSMPGGSSTEHRPHCDAAKALPCYALLQLFAQMLLTSIAEHRNYYEYLRVGSHGLGFRSETSWKLALVTDISGNQLGNPKQEKSCHAADYISCSYKLTTHWHSCL